MDYENEKAKFPFICKVKKTGEEFYPSVIDYWNEDVQRDFEHVPDDHDGWEKYSFSELEFRLNPDYKDKLKYYK